MRLKLHVRAEVLQLVTKKRLHFSSFRQAAEYREATISNDSSHLRQFKTEKWLQAELIHYFWAKGILAIPEFSQKKWDICLTTPDDQQRFLLALKCLPDSAQSARGDFDGGSPKSKKMAGVVKDLDAISKCSSKEAALLLILPLDKKDKKRREYTVKMLEFVSKYALKKALISKKKIPFKANHSEGVLAVWIRPLSLRARTSG